MDDLKAGDLIVTNKRYIHGRGWKGTISGPSTAGDLFPASEGWFDVAIEGAPVRTSYVHKSEMDRREQ